MNFYPKKMFFKIKTHFKAVRAPLGPKRTISTWLGASRYNLIKIGLKVIFKNKRLNFFFLIKNSFANKVIFFLIICIN